ncbi:MAG: cadherin-like domain-containing protein, partial [Methylotenera sp.]
DSPLASLTATGLSISAGAGSLVDNLNGTWTYTPALNDDTAVSFTYTVSDGSLTAAGSAALDITPVNDAPTTTPVTLAPIAEDSGARLITQAELLANAADIDSPLASLTATGLSISAGAGSLVDNLNGTWTYTPALNDDTAVSFSYIISDATTAISGAANLNITAVNDAPTTTPVTLAAIIENSGPRLITQAQLLANTADVDSPNLTATGLSISNGAGSLANNGDGTWTYTPTTDDNAAVSFIYFVTDGNLTAATSANMDITPLDLPVTPTPPAPVPTPTPPAPVPTPTPPAPVPTPTPPAVVPTPPAVVTPVTPADPLVNGNNDAVFTSTRETINNNVQRTNVFSSANLDSSLIRFTNQLITPFGNISTALQVLETIDLPAFTNTNLTGNLSALVNSITQNTNIQVETIKFFEPNLPQNQKIAQLIIEHKTALSSVAVTVGLVTWAVQLGALFTSVLATVPAWKNLDPIAILGKDDEDDAQWDVSDDEDEEIEENAEESAADMWSGKNRANLNRNI